MPKTVGAWPSQEERQSTAEGRRETGNETSNLTVRYGKIGISAVAAAMCHKSEERNATESHFEPYDRD